jgi:hypothetical protein
MNVEMMAMHERILTEQRLCTIAQYARSEYGDPWM